MTARFHDCNPNKKGMSTMTYFRPVTRTSRPIFSFVPVERVRPRPAAIAAEPEPQPEPEPQIEGAPFTVTPMADLLELVAKICEHKPGDITGRRRFPDLVRTRQIFCYVAHKQFGKGFAPIGRIIDRNHSTVMYAVRKVSEHREEFEPYLSRILAKLPPEPIQTLQEPTQ